MKYSAKHQTKPQDSDFLSLQSAYELIKSKDKRFDGRFYWGVKTTAIYCRPTCGANPKVSNIKIYKSKAEAENAGLRPCLRCRPDLSPQSPLWEGTAAVVHRALRLLNQSQDIGLPEVCAKLGLTDRHLRRLFQEHLGAAPMDVILSDRLHMARGFLAQTQLNITEIAYASGFQSIRRFNDAFQKKYRRNPRDFRKNYEKNKMEKDLEITLLYHAPYDWSGLTQFLKRHLIYGTESFENNVFTRKLWLNNKLSLIQVENEESKNQLKVTIQNANSSHLKWILKKIRRVFDIDHNPHFLVQKKWPQHQKWSGVRIPGCFDSFETLVSIVLGQLVSTEQAQAKIQKLVNLYGQKIDAETILFPTPEVMLKSDLKLLGITKVKEHALKELAKLALQNKMEFLDSQEVQAEIQAIKGIGPWTFEMMKLRCLNETDAYPHSDLIIQRAAKSLNLDSEAFRPWRSYFTLWIWQNYAAVFTQKNKLKNKLKNKQPLIQKRK